MSARTSHEAAERVDLEELPCACFIVTGDGLVRAANHHAGTLLSTVASALVGRRVLSLYADRPEGRPRAERLHARFRDGRSIDGEVVAFRAADGRTVWGQLWVQCVRDDTGRTVESRSLVIDLTAQRAAETATRRSEQRFRAAFDDAPTAAALLDADEGILRANAALVELLGSDPTGAPLHSVFADPAADLPADGAHDDRQLATTDGDERWARITVATIRSDRGDAARGLAHFEDVTATRRLRHELHRAAVRDPLTRLLNRRGLTERSQGILAAADRHQRPTGLLFLDVVGLKQVNDTRGHAAGDRLLCEVADALRRRFRVQDQLARWGGDEFCVLLEDTGTNELEQLVTSWQETAGTPSTGTRRLRAGIAVRPPGSPLDLGGLIDAADQDMYGRRLRDPRRT